MMNKVRWAVNKYFYPRGLVHAGVSRVHEIKDGELYYTMSDRHLFGSCSCSDAGRFKYFFTIGDAVEYRAENSDLDILDVISRNADLFPSEKDALLKAEEEHVDRK